MQTFLFTLAYRYLKGTQEEKNISFMTKICFWSILIGSLALVLVTAVMNGFEQTTKEKFQTIHPEIFMQSLGQRLNVNAIGNVLNDEFPEVIGYAPRASQYVIMHDPNDNKSQFVMNLRGIDPLREKCVSNLEETVIQTENNKPLDELLHGNTILIGKKLAEQLNLSLGDTVELFYMSKQPTSRKVRLSQKIAHIGGFFSSGIIDFDTSLILTSLDYFNTLFADEGIKQLGLKISPQANRNITIAKLRCRFGLDIFPWQELYPALLQALRLEKYAMFFILALITLVASMNIISLLFMVITQKRGDIAILKSMGMSNKEVLTIFMYMGIFMAIFATSIGLLIGFGIGLLLTWFPFISLPNVYYVSHLPIKLEPEIFVAVFMVVLIMSIIATWIATHRTRDINIAQVLRFEG
jgi:lipoprotein-releasing system permease protein